MSTNQNIKIKTQEEIEQSFFHIPFWIAPDQSVFAKRSERFTTLANQDKTQWKDYLLMLAQVCEVQDALLSHPGITPVVTDTESIYNLPEIHSGVIPACFDVLLVAFYDKIKPELADKSQQTWRQLLDMPADERRAMASRVLAQEAEAGDQDYSIWVHAVLQVIWTHWAMQLKEPEVPTREEREYCPCCGSDGVGNVILNGGELDGLRYLQCNLCNSRWHALRAKCTFCGNTKDMNFQSVEGVEEGALHGASGECCEACHGYRKTYQLSKEQFADPVADDLATLAVDILLNEKGYLRGGANPYLIVEEEVTH